MKTLFAALALALLSSACTYVSSAMPGSNATTGEGWYTKTTMVLFLPVSNDVFFCTKEEPTRCMRAQMRETQSSPAPPPPPPR